MLSSSPETDALYVERYCAFIDILGFREMIVQLDQGGATAASVIELMQTIRAPVDTSADIRVESISDAVAISSGTDPRALQTLLDMIEKLTIKLLVLGFFIRGGLVKGRLYHDRNTIFGNALVRAYHFESHIARYARVVVSREVKLDVDRFTANGHGALEGRLHQDEDGPFYVNSLRDIMTEGSLMPGETLLSNAIGHDLVEMGTAIQRRYDEAADTPSHFEKVQWFARYWNSIRPNIQGIPRIQGLT
jgi:hypothetical protein